MTDTVNACPECDDATVYRRESKQPPWRCGACGHEFEEPVSRESKRDRDDDTDADPDDADDVTDETPSAAPLDTPDAAFADVEIGDKLSLTRADGRGYKHPLAVVEIRERTVWTTPFGDDWVDAEVMLSDTGHATKPYYRADVSPDGSVTLYRPYPDQHVRTAEKPVADIESAEVVGEVTTSSKLKLLEDSPDIPEGDDSWKQVGGERA